MHIYLIIHIHINMYICIYKERILLMEPPANGLLKMIHHFRLTLKKSVGSFLKTTRYFTSKPGVGP